MAKCVSIASLFRFPKCVVEEAKVSGKVVRARIRYDRRYSFHCPECKKPMRVNRRAAGTARDLPLGEAKAVIVRYEAIECCCASCRFRYTFTPEGIEPDAGVTTRLIHHVRKLCRTMPADNVTKLVPVSASTVREWEERTPETAGSPGSLSRFGGSELDGLRAFLSEEEFSGRDGVPRSDPGESPMPAFRSEETSERPSGPETHEASDFERLESQREAIPAQLARVGEHYLTEGGRHVVVADKLRDAVDLGSETAADLVGVSPEGLLVPEEGKSEQVDDAETREPAYQRSGEEVKAETPTVTDAERGDAEQPPVSGDDTAMKYFEHLGLRQEPFSTSPDPAFFYASPSCANALERLEVEVRLRRGLNLVLGEVGMGKTTMARVLVRRFEENPEDFVCRLLSDPRHADERELLTELVWIFEVRTEGNPVLVLRNALRNFLFEKALQEGKTVVLIVDEGQALSEGSVEVLRHLLNFETNEQKLLQLVIFGQPEFRTRLQEQYNFADRVNYGFVMRPFSHTATREMIEFRLKKAGLNEGAELFTEEALRAIHLCAQGIPRRITMLCHDGLMAMLSRGRKRVDVDLISFVAKRRAMFNGRR